MSLQSSKNLGGIGAILLVIGPFLVFVPFVSAYASGAIGLIGLILVLIALNRLANYHNDRRIFTNALYGVIIEIVAVIATFAALIYEVFYTNLFSSLFDKIYGTGWNWSTIPSMTPNTANVGYNDVISIVGTILLVGVIFFILTIVATVLIWRSLKALSTKAKVGLFSTAGILMIVGAVLTIILIGLIILWIGVLLLAVAFFTMKPQEPVMTATVPPQQMPPPS
jgi:uncharacterized membrane protein